MSYSEYVHNTEQKKLEGVFYHLADNPDEKESSASTLSHSNYYYVCENENGEIEIQYINKNYIPYGKKKRISKEDLFQNYSPEPAVFFNRVKPASRQVDKTNARGERHRKQKEYFSAEYEFNKVLQIDEDNIRATFNLGITYLDRNDRQKANQVFVKLVQLKEPFEVQHKHLFNEFGIKLRKQKMFKQALKYYGRAYKLEKNDEHLYFNIARIFYELGKIDKCEKMIKKAIEINPHLKEANILYQKVHKFK